MSCFHVQCVFVSLISIKTSWWMIEDWQVCVGRLTFVFSFTVCQQLLLLHIYVLPQYPVNQFTCTFQFLCNGVLPLYMHSSSSGGSGSILPEYMSTSESLSSLLGVHVDRLVFTLHSELVSLETKTTSHETCSESGQTSTQYRDWPWISLPRAGPRSAYRLDQRAKSWSLISLTAQKEHLLNSNWFL